MAAVLVLLSMNNKGIQSMSIVLTNVEASNFQKSERLETL